MASQARASGLFAGHDAGWPDEHRSTFPIVSQDLRTSLNVILGLVEMLADPGFGATEREGFVRRIRNEGQTLLERVETTLASGARMESDGVPLRRTHRARRGRAGRLVS
jgi:K+-sensing histidine kinase KdpD